MTAREIYLKNDPQRGYRRNAWMRAESTAIAAIQEALNIGEFDRKLQSDAIKAASTRLAELEKENRELREVLENLVQLKRWKDRNGKDEHYAAKIDAVWYKAFEIIDTKTFNNGE
jgi:hypothetical protein